MASNRAFRMKLLLAIDIGFFFLELSVGIAVSSLALLADSFHLLNDVVCLVVALQALKLAENSTASSKYSYGWQRAEVLGAAYNAVFLVALCFSIGIESIARFFSDVEISNPKLMVGVGCAGLASNIIGLFLFADHGHSHGGHSHGHSHSHSHGDEEAATPKPKTVHSHSHSHSHSTPTDRTPLLSSSTSSQTPTIVPSSAVSDSTKVSMSSASSDTELEVEEAEDQLFVHPTEFRENIVKAAHDAGYGASGHSHARRASVASNKKVDEHAHGHSHAGHVGHDHGAGDHEHHDHAHEDDATTGGLGGHDHGNMNMRGVFLHVLGDALGNVGVIAAGLLIWLTDYSWKHYADPAISLVITCIIFSSALPLVKSASFILLQGVPSSVPLDRVRTSIAAVPGVINVHELHVWSLSESKTVASVHIMCRGEDFVSVSKSIRKVMHRFGIHSSTIQPEIVASSAPGVGGESHVTGADAAVISLEQEGCLIQCVDDSCAPSSCCAPPTETK